MHMKSHKAAHRDAQARQRQANHRTAYKATVPDQQRLTKHHRPSYSGLAKEWLDKPFARSTRCTADWRSVGQDEYEAPLPGSNTVTMRVGGRGWRRCWTTLDTSLACTVLALLAMQHKQMVKGTTVVLGTYKDTLALLGYAYDTGNRNALKDSLDYLQRIEMTVKHDRVTRRLPPPFQHVSFEGGVLTVTIDKGFYLFATGFGSNKRRGSVPLPLPKDPAVQNLLFLIAGSTWQADDVGDGEKYQFRRFGKMYKIARQVGLDHTTWYRDFRRALCTVEAIYAKLKCTLKFGEVHGDAVATLKNLTKAKLAFKRTIFLTVHRDRAPTFKRVGKPRIKQLPMQKLRPKRRELLWDGLRYEQVPAHTEDGRRTFVWLDKATGRTSLTDPRLEKNLSQLHSVGEA
jgi:hypothetical protein